jgi:hypothetical protein
MNGLNILILYQIMRTEIMRHQNTGSCSVSLKKKCNKSMAVVSGKKIHLDSVKQNFGFIVAVEVITNRLEKEYW